MYIPKKWAEAHSAFHINFCDVVDCNVLCGQSRSYSGSQWTATGANLLNHYWEGGVGVGGEGSNYNVRFPRTFPNLIAAMFA